MVSFHFLWIVVIGKLIYKRIGVDSLASKAQFVVQKMWEHDFLCGGGTNFWKAINVSPYLLGSGK